MPFWKRDNPGSSCCNCCPCYSLDKGGQTTSGSTDYNLIKKDGGPAASPVKKLGEGAAGWQSGVGYLEHADDTCYSPVQNTDGWAMSFWIKPITNMLVRVCQPTKPLWRPGVITKGYWEMGLYNNCLAPTQGSATTHGEWFFVLDRNSESATAPVSLIAYIVTNNSPGGSGATWTFASAGGKILDTRSSTFGTEAAEWNFVYWYIRNNHSWIVFRGETESSWNLQYKNFNLLGGIKNESVPLRVGTMIEGSNEYRLGDLGGEYAIDNILFDRDPFTYGSTSSPMPTPEVIPPEAVKLYNSGNGLLCPNSGR